MDFFGNAFGGNAMFLIVGFLFFTPSLGFIQGALHQPLDGRPHLVEPLSLRAVTHFSIGLEHRAEFPVHGRVARSADKFFPGAGQVEWQCGAVRYRTPGADLIDQIGGTKNISVMANTEVSAVGGADHLETVTIKNNKTGTTDTLPADAIFIFIGAVPHSDIVAGIVERDEAGFIYTGPDLIHDGRRPTNWKLKRDPFLLETSVPGIFAAGDVRHGVIRRVASAVGQGAVAVSLVHQYLETV